MNVYLLLNYLIKQKKNEENKNRSGFGQQSHQKGRVRKTEYYRIT